jgi:hypothetical protein
VTHPGQPTILFLGGDAALVYLIERYARRSGCRVRVERTPPASSDISALQPAVVWFSSLESLAAFQPRETGLVGDDIPLVVCSSTADEARARELGADYCAVHPLTYPDFLTALSAVGVATTERRR